MCSQQSAAMGMRACDHVTLQGKRSPTVSGILWHCAVVSFHCHPVLSAFLQPDSQVYKYHLQIPPTDTTYTCPETGEGSAPHPGTAGWQESDTQGQKFWDWGKREGEEGLELHLAGLLSALGDEVPPVCLSTAFPSHSSPRVFLLQGCCHMDPPSVVPLC